MSNFWPNNKVIIISRLAKEGTHNLVWSTILQIVRNRLADDSDDQMRDL